MHFSLKQLWEEFKKDNISINLSDLAPKSKLSVDIWDDSMLKSDVRDKLLAIAREWFEGLELKDAEIDDITLTGSVANYNWTRFSDIDLHILVDFSKIDENYDLVREYFSAKTSLWNRKHKIMVNGFEVELYVQDPSEPHHSTGVYSIKNDEWATKPARKEAKIDVEMVKKKAFSFIDEVERAEDLFEDQYYADAHAYTEKLFDKIRKYRRSGLESGGEYSTENLVFKVLRRNSYLGVLRDILTKSYDKMMSIGNNFVKKLKIYVSRPENHQKEAEKGFNRLNELEKFQKKVKKRHLRMKRRLIGGGKQKNTPPFTKKPSYKRGKSAPPGFGGT